MNDQLDTDVVIVGGGPAGSVLACMLADAGHRVLVIERDIHPREHVGESLTPASNRIWHDIGFRSKIEDAGFVHKPGTAWTAPRSAVGQYFSLRLTDFPTEDTPAPFHTYNVERDVFDAMLLRHASEKGARVLQGVRVTKVLFDGDRAVGVRAQVDDGWERDISARFVVDASGRRCVLGSALGLKTHDPKFHQFGVYSWFTGLAPVPPPTEGMIFLHFLGLERAWVWQIPLRNGITSVGVVTERTDFTAGQDNAQFFASMIDKNRTLRHSMRGARQIRPFRVEADYSYQLSQLTGKGWLVVGDALRFVDPIFSTGMDVAAFSGLHAFGAIDGLLRGGDEGRLLADYERTVTSGVSVYYDLISMFYRLQNLFTFYASKEASKETVIRILQGNPYAPGSQRRARAMIELMEESRARIQANPDHLLRTMRLREPAR